MTKAGGSDVRGHNVQIFCPLLLASLLPYYGHCFRPTIQMSQCRLNNRPMGTFAVLFYPPALEDRDVCY